MDILINTIYHLWDQYNYYLSIGDERVENWLFMQAYWPTLTLTCTYLLIVYIGPKWMKDRAPFELKWPLFTYNVILVLINLHICTELYITTSQLGYSYLCQKVDYSNNKLEIRVAAALWWFYFSKFVEFFDTFFFILRKKDNQITFLHVYHHATMFPIWWMGIKWVAGGQSFFGAMMNSFVHVLMYSYYGLASLGPKVQKYLWWKSYLTQVQLIQFVIGMAHAAQSIYFQCPFPLWMQWALMFYGTTILSLFLNFYFHAYISGKSRAPKGAANGAQPEFPKAKKNK